MVELAFTHLGYFLKVASKKLIFFVFGFFFSGAAVCVETCFCGIPMFKSGVLIKLLLGIHSLFQFLLMSFIIFYTVGIQLVTLYL